MRVLELVNSCTSWASSNKQSFALELFRVLGKILLELHCNLRLFLPNPSSLIHRLLQVSDLYLESFPPLIPTPFPLKPGQVFPLTNLLFPILSQHLLLEGYQLSYRGTRALVTSLKLEELAQEPGKI